MDVKELYQDVEKYLEKEVKLEGWVRNHRKQAHFGFIDFDANEAHKALRKHFREARKGVEHTVAHEKRERKHAQRGIGIDAKNGFGQKFAGNQNDNGGNDGDEDKLEKFVSTKPSVNRLADKARHRHTVDHIHHIITHEHGGYKHIAVAVERMDDAVHQSAFLDINFKAHLIRRHKGDFHAGKECRQEHRDEHYDKRICGECIHTTKLQFFF